MISSIKKVIPRPLKDRLRYLFLLRRIKNIKTKFSNASTETKWLDKNEFDKLMKKYPINEVQSYEKLALKSRAEYRVKEMNNYINLSRLKKTLEIGCYDGMVSKELKDNGKEAYAVDIRSWIQEEAKEAGVKHYVMDAANLKFTDNSFDFIFTYDSFEHFSDPEKVLLEASRVLKKNGYFFISFGNCFHSAKALHINDKINIPYCQLLFKKELLNKYVKDHELGEIHYDFINNWTNRQFKKLWKKHESNFKIIKYKEILNLNNLEIISEYPSIFRSKTNDFNDLIVNDFIIVLKKI